MSGITIGFNRPGLLVSVRNVAEAQTALAAGADVIDVKEPNRGPLGAADLAEIDQIVKAIKARVTVTAAMGELLELEATMLRERSGLRVPQGISLYKMGLAGCGTDGNWQSHWQKIITTLRDEPYASDAKPVAVVYADWKTANAPDPQDVLRAGTAVGCPALLVDTWDKSSGGLFDHWSVEGLQDFVRQVQREQMIVVLAGALVGDRVRLAASLGPELVAVRGAACEKGRNSAVSFDRVRFLKQLLAESELSETAPGDASKATPY